MLTATSIVIWTNRLSGMDADNSFENFTHGLLIFGISYILLSAMFGYYRGAFHLNYRARISIAARSYVVSIFITVAVTMFIPEIGVNKHGLFLFFLVFPPLFLMVKYFLRLLNKSFQKRGFGVHPALIAGFDAASLHIYNHFASLPELGYTVHGFIMKEKDSRIDVHPQFSLTELEEVVEKFGIDRIFIPSTDLVVNGYSSLKRISRQKHIKLKVLSSQSEELLRFSKVYDIAGITLTSPPRYKVDGLKLAVKRLFDIVGSSMIITFLSPVFIITALLIYLEDGKPVFYKQKRTSTKGGRVFHFIKFRSMVQGAEALVDELQKQNESDGALFKMKNDPRITKIGHFLRKFSIDELPQLFNVLKGDMSLVGPRPLPPGDFSRVNAPDEFWDAMKQRAEVKPGMTGLWQVSGRSEIKFNEMLLLDLYYVENHSLLFDLEILFETIPTVLFGKGAY